MPRGPVLRRLHINNSLSTSPKLVATPDLDPDEDAALTADAVAVAVVAADGSVAVAAVVLVSP